MFHTTAPSDTAVSDDQLEEMGLIYPPEDDYVAHQVEIILTFAYPSINSQSN